MPSCTLLARAVCAAFTLTCLACTSPSKASVAPSPEPDASSSLAEEEALSDSAVEAAPEAVVEEAEPVGPRCEADCPFEHRDMRELVRRTTAGSDGAARESLGAEVQAIMNVLAAHEPRTPSDLRGDALRNWSELLMRHNDVEDEHALHELSELRGVSVEALRSAHNAYVVELLRPRR